MRIGICDDNIIERDMIKKLCNSCANNIEKDYALFASGEEVLEYADREDAEQLDLLFLDVEMSGISGIELKKYYN